MKTIPIFPKITPSNLPMELIVRITERCNFKCTFCSSTYITEDKTMELDIERVFAFLHRYPNTSTIIVNGGDPLMVKPDYYWKLIEFLDNNNMRSSISFTSNLWAFFKKPAMWADLFKHPRMGITTSFNYGDTRRITETRIFTETDFWKISDKMLDVVGYRPDFISVITQENENTAIDNVYLAKKMGVECKLNLGLASGDQSVPYQLSKIYAMYLEVYKLGLMPWEYNTKQMVRRLSEGSTTCPQSRDCDKHIRALNPGGDYYSCGAFADDFDKQIDFNREVYGGEHFLPLSTDGDLWCLKNDCLTCPMFNICNGCRKTVKDMKQHNMVEQHCKLMKTLAPDILRINFANQPEQLKKELARV